MKTMDALETRFERAPRLLGVKGATMSALLDRPARAGWWLRDAGATDRRIKPLRLTTAGVCWLHQFKNAAQALGRAFPSRRDQDALLAATTMLEALQHARIDETDAGPAGANR